MANQVVIFTLGQEEYSMPIEVVKEITRLGNVRSIPQAPDFVKGLINLRGSAIPLIDLHRRFGLEASSEGECEFALITEIGESIIGFAVDQVKEVCVLDNVVPPPPVFKSPYIGGIVNLPDRIIIEVIPEKILEEDEIANISQLAQF